MIQLSILTPALISRAINITSLCEEMERQIGALPVEHLILIDNKRRTVGEKRDALLRAAHGKYVAFVDDDDLVSQNYVSEILEATKQEPSVVTFLQEVDWNGHKGMVEFKLGNPNETFNFNGITRRPPWHICAWRRSIAIQSSFPASNYGEDLAFSKRLFGAPGLTEVHIPKILHTYVHSNATTEAPPPAA